MAGGDPHGRTRHPQQPHRIERPCAWARRARVNPYERDGGGNTPDGRLNFDSGILNPELFRRLGPEASAAYAKARLRDRIDAGIAHEYEEVRGGGSHEYACEHAPETELPIRQEARALARTIREGERRRRRGR